MQLSLPPPSNPGWGYTRAERVKRRLLSLPVVVRALAALVAALGGLQALGLFDSGSSEPTDPFFHTEAADWPDAHEIPMSKAEATEHVDAERVGELLGDVRAFLIAGRVEWPLGDHDRSG